MLEGNECASVVLLRVKNVMLRASEISSSLENQISIFAANRICSAST